MIHYSGHMYYDDRLYVMNICRSTAEVTPEGYIATTVYYKEYPSNAKWCVVIHENWGNYPPYSVINFETEGEAFIYKVTNRTLTPLISLNGKSPDPPLSCDKYFEWLSDNNLKDFDYRKVFPGTGTNPCETILTEAPRNQDKKSTR